MHLVGLGKIAIKVTLNSQFYSPLLWNLEYTHQQNESFYFN